MITENELNISNQSYTKKDFMQIYNEILTIAKQLSNRWDPQYSNESDPGVVLLKLLAFVADKNNYQIDKKVLEVFMPSATQEESMRKLTEMMGYNMKYIQSATTTVAFSWNSDAGNLSKDIDSVNGNFIFLPKFTTNITDSESTINYVLTEDVLLNHRYEAKTGSAIEGTYVEYEINSDNVVLASNLDSNNRLYLPETQIAENGIFITTTGESDPDWTKVDNLNTQLAGQKVWKFGFDSLQQKPYIQFPDDVISLIPNGFKLAYIRSSGSNGNISANKLTTLVNASLTVYDYTGTELEDTENNPVDASDGNMTIVNSASANNGTDIETLDEAYNNFKKTVGTFETLVNCRDYANTIYNMVRDETYDNTNLVSNVQIGDVSNDLNYSRQVATYDGYGISNEIVSDDTFNKTTIYDVNGSQIKVYDADGNEIEPYTKTTNNRFNIYIYPLNPIKSYTQAQFIDSFNLNSDNVYEIKNQLAEVKSLNHLITQVTGSNEYALIKNYYSLNGKLVTTTKLTNYEVLQVQQAVYTALYKNFNARAVEYGEDIPYETLCNVMLNADSRIKAVTLDEPSKESYIMFAKASTTGGSQEYKLRYNGDSTDVGNNAYIKFVARNVLAGRAPLFNYDTEFDVKYNQTVSDDPTIYGHTYNEDYNYVDDTETPTEDEMKKKNITHITTNLKIPMSWDSNTKTATFTEDKSYTLGENEQLQLISNSLATLTTYPAYVNYYLHLENAEGSDATPAYMESLDNCGADYSTLISNITPKDGELDYKYYYLKYWLTKYGFFKDGNDHSNDTIKTWLNAYHNYIDSKTPIDTPESPTTIFEESEEGEETQTSKNITYARNVKFYKEASTYSAQPGNLVSVNRHQYTAWTSSNASGYSNIFKSIAEFPNTNQWFIWEKKTIISGSSAVTTVTLLKCYDYFNDVDTDKVSKEYKNIASFYGNFTNEDLKKQLLEDLQKYSGSALVSKLNTTYGFNRADTSYSSYPSSLSGVWTTDWKQLTQQLGSNQTTEYKIDYVNYNYGVDSYSEFIPSNTLYELRLGDCLYINYTDSDDVIHNLEYRKDSITDNGIIIVNGSTEMKKYNDLGTMVIKANFDMYDSDRYSTKHSYAKTSGYLRDWTDVAGMFSLGTSDEIRLMKNNSTKVDTDANWYWTADGNKLTFKLSDSTKSTDTSATYSLLLEDGEYIYYTDQTKSELLTLGSGTQLRFITDNSAAKDASGNWKTTLVWSFQDSEATKVTTDSILENGISAFSSINWQSNPFGIHFNDTNYLQIDVLTISTFTEGDVLNSTVPKKASIEEITSEDWTEIEQLTVNNQEQCSGIDADTTVSTGETSNSALTGLYHKIRPILNINMGPNLSQTLSSHDGKVTQELAAWTSIFKDSGDNIISNTDISEYFNNTTEIYSQERYTTSPVHSWSVSGTADDVDLRATCNIQKVANPNGVLVSKYSISLLRTDDTKIYQITSTPATYTTDSQSDLTLQTNNNNTIYTKISLKNINSVKLPIYIPSGKCGLIAFYYIPDTNSGYGPKITANACSMVNLNAIATTKTEIKIPDTKITVIKILDATKGAYITISNNDSKSTGVLMVKDMDIVKKSSDDDIYCFNESYLGIPGGSAALYSQITSLDTTSKFYWNLPADNSEVIDETTLDSPVAWINKNNLFARYVLPELDVKTFSNITVAKSSKVNS